MRIRSSSLSKPESGSAQGPRSKEARAESTASTHAGQEDRVATGRQSELVSQVLQTDSVERTDRVHELKSALEAGEYKADPEQVSKAIVAEALSNHG